MSSTRALVAAVCSYSCHCNGSQTAFILEPLADAVTSGTGGQRAEIVRLDGVQCNRGKFGSADEVRPIQPVENLLAGDAIRVLRGLL